mgnify:CR=1 FL=1
MRRFLTPILGLFLLTSALLVCGCDNSALHPNIGLVRVFGDLPDPLPVGSAEFDSAMTRVCAVPARPCPPPQLLSNGEQYFPMLLADIARARSEVLLVTYILRDDRVGKAACQALAAAARRGVRVSILLDSIGSWNPGVPEMVAQLREAGASVSVINPLLGWTALRINNRCHVKLTVIDGSIGYVAGLNLSEKYAGEIGRASCRERV